jgi:histidinol dehydrogenase
VVPAQAAGVHEIAIASPPTGGRISDLALALAGELGVHEVYQLGGAVAIAALAYGTESIRPVHKIVGPGNAFVAEAKRQVFGRVGIDSVAGPSEVVIVADDSADPELASLTRAEMTRASLQRYGAVVISTSLDAACDLANEIAAEHLQVMTSNDARCLDRIRNAGAIFVGKNTPVPLGDYFAGPSHVLPTGGTAKFFGPLSVNDFLKASSLIEYDATALAEDSRSVQDFAMREGLDAHAAAVRKRTS